MGKTYSVDLRERVLAACDADSVPEAVAPVFRISARCIYNWLELRKETGSLEPRHTRTGPKPKLAEYGQQLRELIARRSDITLEELRSELPIKVCIGTLWATLRSLGLSLKKSHPSRRAVASRR
jgi:transposase